MDLGGKDDYIYLAANQICLAQECEANGSYETAFTCYKTGVGILLQGVQGKYMYSYRAQWERLLLIRANICPLLFL